MSIDCVPGSCLGSASTEQIEGIQKYLSMCYERQIALPSEFIQQAIQCHGGVPVKRCFKLPNGRVRVVCRFCNLLRRSDLSPPVEPTWRQWSDHDIRKDYSINSLLKYETWCVRFDEKASRCLVPFAAIDFAGHDAREMDVFDLLCFDYAASNPPPVVYWEYEEFHRYKARRNFVAASFSDFCKMLYEDPQNPIVQEEVTHF